LWSLCWTSLTLDSQLAHVLGYHHWCRYLLAVDGRQLLPLETIEASQISSTSWFAAFLMELRIGQFWVQRTVTVGSPFDLDCQPLLLANHSLPVHLALALESSRRLVLAIVLLSHHGQNKLNDKLRVGAQSVHRHVLADC